MVYWIVFALAECINLLALGILLLLACAILRKVETIMSDVDDLGASVEALEAAQGEAFAAIDKELQQVTDLLSGTSLPPQVHVAIQSSVSRIQAATDALKASTAKLQADDPIPTPVPEPTPTDEPVDESTRSSKKRK
jgi:outer membrane murein-binding lipoprotein Lpp